MPKYKNQAKDHALAAKNKPTTLLLLDNQMVSLRLSCTIVILNSVI